MRSLSNGSRVTTALIRKETRFPSPSFKETINLLYLQLSPPEVRSLSNGSVFDTFDSIRPETTPTVHKIEETRSARTSSESKRIYHQRSSVSETINPREARSLRRAHS